MFDKTYKDRNIVKNGKPENYTSELHFIEDGVQHNTQIWSYSQIPNNFRVRSLVITDLHSETKGSRLESGC